jgi:hypothetical protein
VQAVVEHSQAVQPSRDHDLRGSRISSFSRVCRVRRVSRVSRLEG